LRPADDYVRSAMVLRWVDGDTVRLLVDLGFKVKLEVDARLYGLNTPESRSKDKAEKKRGLAAKAFAEALAPPGSVVPVRSHKCGNEKYGRWLAEVLLANGTTVNEQMLANGHAIAWDGRGERPI
jgi:micrococcal nuclease